MRHLETVEDYIAELFEGSNIGFIRANRDDIQYRLASYDNRIIQSIYNQVTFQNIALTNKQAELCVKLIEKYTRQFRRAGIDNFKQLDSATRCFRFPIREIDRTCSIVLEDNKIVAKFPYDIKIISSIKRSGEKIAGSADWDKNKKIWVFDLTEPYVTFVVNLGREYDFEIDSKLLEIYDRITNENWDQFRIKLIERNGKYTIQNASDSLKEYINANVGNDIIKLVDYSGICGYEVDNNVEVQIKQAHSEGVAKCLLNRHAYLDPAQYTFWEIFDYADLVGRFPITIYDTLGHWSAETNFSYIRERYLTLYERYGPIYHHNLTLPKDWPYKNANPNTAKIRIYNTATKEMFQDDRVPLMISCQNFNYGSLRMKMFEKSDKIVYHCTKL
jgi:hypothetical protein